MNYNPEEEVLAIVGHHFRHDLTTITDLVNALLAEMRDGAAKSLEADLKTIKQHARSALRLIDPLLDLVATDPQDIEMVADTANEVISLILSTADETLFSLDGTFTRDVSALSGNVSFARIELVLAVQNAVSALSAKAGTSQLFGAAERTENTVICRIQTAEAVLGWAEKPIDQWLSSNDETRILVSMYQAMRLARMSGGEMRLLTSKRSRKQKAIVFIFPLRIDPAIKT